MIEVPVGDEDARAAAADGRERLLDRGAHHRSGRPRPPRWPSATPSRGRCWSRSARARAGRRREASPSSVEARRRNDRNVTPSDRPSGGRSAFSSGGRRDTVQVCSRGTFSRSRRPRASGRPAVLHSGDARAILLRLDPGQVLGDHQVRERAWVTVVEGEVEVECGDARTVAGSRHTRHVRSG